MIVAKVQQDQGFNSGYEIEIATIGVQGNTSLHIGTSSSNVSHDSDKRRSVWFHIRFVTKHTKAETLFDPGSQVNLISESTVKKLG